ncbi:type II toxin-antitoxin system PemK/MazF family toxin [Companilactobacillus ginsenosidimutans]|uniref:Cell division protein FtsN n=1 Tax=Companilactobacillus ginsenosidimutans TaxID=1007676 RepID=A0A0H4QIP4_9LACO|nr:type II toxin-antitoxin system PemK/MazF family toxin [Companilactobacillus ginsenosidimutans]AKP67812.1 cell division protein FtsN [Companilactobacillus ginsenosidimutans]
MAYNFKGYIPQQGDLVYINFDPSVGREIRKRRPGLVISSTEFNAKTGYIVICPITSKIRENSLYQSLHAKKLYGQINTIQYRTMDFLSTERNIEFIEKSNPLDFMKTAESVSNGLNFNSLIDNL